MYKERINLARISKFGKFLERVLDSVQATCRSILFKRTRKTRSIAEAENAEVSYILVRCTVKGK